MLCSAVLWCAELLTSLSCGWLLGDIHVGDVDVAVQLGRHLLPTNTQQPARSSGGGQHTRCASAVL